MFVAFVAVVLLLSVPFAGGRLSALGRIRLRGRWLVAGALLVQVAITGPLSSWPRPLVVSLHVGSYVLIGGAVWLNRRLPGLPVIALGGLMNGVVIALNGGTLPASARALAKAGLVDKHGFNNSGVLAHPKLALFGDIFATPSWLPFRNVISIGDLVALAGVAILAHTVCGSRLAAGGRPNPRTAPNAVTPVNLRASSRFRH